MSVLRHRIERGRYYDSVVLMQLQRGLAEMEGVLEAGVVMGTAANQELLQQSGLLMKPLAEARADDLLIAVNAENTRLGDAALASFDELVKARPTAGAVEYRPRSLRIGLSRLPAARWVLVSVPGRYAAEVARQALAAGRNVFLYSDNVSLEDEVELKRTARERGLLVLGPELSVHRSSRAPAWGSRTGCGAARSASWALPGPASRPSPLRRHALGSGMASRATRDGRASPDHPARGGGRRDRQPGAGLAARRRRDPGRRARLEAAASEGRGAYPRGAAGPRQTGCRAVSGLLPRPRWLSMRWRTRRPAIEPFQI